MSEVAAVRPLTRLQKWIIALALVSMGVGMTISFVVAPPLARGAGLSELQVAGVLTGSALLYAILTPVWGRWANRYGRKRVMVFALIAASVTNALFIITLSAAMRGVLVGVYAFLVLAIVRASFGVLASGLQPSAFAAMTDATTAHDRAAGLGFLGAAMSVGSILGPTGAAALARVGALAPLWGSVGFSFLGALVVLFVLPKDARPSDKARPRPLSMWDSRIRVFLLFMIFYFTAVGCMQQTLAFFVEDRYQLQGKQSVEAAGWVFAVMAITMVLTQTFYVSRYKPRPRMMLPSGLVLIALGYAIAILHMPFWFICCGFAVVGVGSALVVPALNALGTLAVPPQDQGGAAALMAMAPPAGFVIGPLLGGAIYMIHHDLPLMVSATAMVLLLVYALLRMGERPDPA